jgi:hypothetical protein
MRMHWEMVFISNIDSINIELIFRFTQQVIGVQQQMLIIVVVCGTNANENNTRIKKNKKI